MDHYQSTNLTNWNERVAGHTAPDGYSIDRLVDEPDWVTGVVSFDAPAVGDVAGKTLLHSQCHIGTDTLSWAKLGATTTGLDFSPPAIEAARGIAQRLAPSLTAPATFVETEVYAAPDHIDGTFDIVYTSVGAICWMPDLAAWGQVMAHFVKPGGMFYIRDSHPALMTIDEERDDDLLVMKYPYFHQAEPTMFTETESYSGSAKLTNADSYSWFHSLADVINALIGAGLVIDRVEEHRHLDWQFMKSMERMGDPDHDTWVLPADRRDVVPMQFSIKAHKPG